MEGCVGVLEGERDLGCGGEVRVWGLVGGLDFGELSVGGVEVGGDLVGEARDFG